jgi:hypothetical protein
MPSCAPITATTRPETSPAPLNGRPVVSRSAYRKNTPLSWNRRNSAHPASRSRGRAASPGEKPVICSTELPARSSVAPGSSLAVAQPEDQARCRHVDGRRWQAGHQFGGYEDEPAEDRKVHKENAANANPRRASRMSRRSTSAVGRASRLGEVVCMSAGFYPPDGRGQKP